MSKSRISIFTLSITIILITTLVYCSRQTELDKKMITKAFNTPDIISLFSVTADDIKNNIPLYIEQAKNIIDGIIAVPDDQRTFANTARPLDELISLSNLAIAQRVNEALELLSPNDDIRAAAHDAFIQICDFYVDYITSNKALYRVFMAYEAQTSETLSDQQRYFMNNTMSDFKREGLSLPDETLASVNTLRKELASLCADFDRNIAQDTSTVTVARDHLTGLDDDFVSTLARTDDDLYILGVDYPTYFRVMENCSVEATRKILYTAFNNRAYPINNALLKTIITKRDELAQLLGYIDFAHNDIDDQMAHTPEKAQQFIANLGQKSLAKVSAEIAILTQDLPESVELTPQGKIKPWDFAYLENSYKKSHFNIDEQKIAEYFPMQKTIDELLDIYRQFFSIDFHVSFGALAKEEEVPSSGLWHDDVTVVRVLNKEGDQLLGTLLIDLYPRPNKYSHAAHTTIIPATFTPDGTRIPDVSVLIANFSKPTTTLPSFAKASEDRPSLLKRSEVQTFFHEFGHALHAVLGATTIASLSGTHTKTDFVELPSQMLEEWLTDKDILKKISGHYIAGQPLPDDIIDTIISLKNLTTGYFVTRQVYLSSIALSYFGLGNGSSFAKASADKDPHAIMKHLYTRILPHMAFSEDNHFYTSFGHLTGYGAKYYGYLWSKVFALDIFAEIKNHGLLDPVIGQKYVKEVLSKGGAQDPNELLYNFLGREPNEQAFFKAMGLN
jgi:thimet oligopeptidase